MTFVKKILMVALPLVLLAGCATEQQVEKANMTAADAAKSAADAAKAASAAAKAAQQAARAAERAAAEARAAGDKADRIFRKGLRK